MSIFPPRSVVAASPATSGTAAGLQLSGSARATLAGCAAAAIFLLALLPRLGALDVYVTADEGNWVERTALFSVAVKQGNAAGTYLTGHPGVVTMWAGLLGMGFERGTYLASNLAQGNISSDQRAYFDALVRGRLPLTIFTCLATVAIALLTWRLFGMLPGLLAGGLLALEPFWVAHALVLHLDASLTGWLIVSMLSALIYFVRGGHFAYLALSGAAAGLALLSKTPGLFIFAYVPMVAGLSLLTDTRRRRRLDGWARTAGLLLAWVGVAALVMLLVWPALRLDPVGTIVRAAEFTRGTGGTDHANFFLNDSTGAPGVLYYPVTLLLRMSLATLLGLMLAAAAFATALLKGDPRRVAVAALLVAYCVLFVAMMDLLPKKFDRYLLPLYPSLVVLAALGYVWAAQRLRPRTGAAPLAVGLAVIFGVQLWQSASTRPYFMSYYSPLLGGAAAARDLIVVGWGEGMDVVARHLDAQPNADSLTVATFYNSVFAAQFRGNIMSPNTYQPVSADFALLYVNVSQRSLADRLRAAIRRREPYMIVRINGLEYVRAYRIEDEVGGAVPAEFGDLVRLERYRIENPSGQPGAAQSALLRWKLIGRARNQLDTYLDFVRTDGWVAFRQVAPLRNERPLSEWRPGDEAVLSYEYLVPTDLPAGRYRLVVGVRDPATGHDFPVTSAPAGLVSPPGGYDTGLVITTIQH